MKNAFFPGNTAWNEHSKWLELFTTPVSIESNAQNFSNFGSKNESYSNDVGVDSIIDKICEKLAIDVFHEIRNDVKPNQRSAYTAHCERQKCKPINGNQAAKISKNNPEKPARAYSDYSVTIDESKIPAGVTMQRMI